MTQNTKSADDDLFSTAAFIEAIKRSDMEVIVSMRRHANVNGRNAAGDSPLGVASRLCRYDVASYLVSEGADPAAGDTLCDPIHSFASNGWNDLVDVALNRGADPFRQVQNYSSGFLNAAQTSQHAIVERIATHTRAKGTLTPDDLCHALYLAGSPEVVDVLMSFGADANAQVKGEETPLTRAARAGNAEVCKRLIHHGADLESRAAGKTPLYYAALYARPEAVLALLEAGATQESISDKGESLNEVARVGGTEVVVALESWRARNALATVAAAARASRKHTPQV